MSGADLGQWWLLAAASFQGSSDGAARVELASGGEGQRIGNIAADGLQTVLVLAQPGQ